MARTEQLTEIGVLSSGKVMGAICAGIGFIIGLLYGLGILVMSVAAASGGGGGRFAVGILFGCGIVIVAPLLYGIFGFLYGLLLAFIYNLAAGRMGGLELTFEDVQTAD